MTNDLKKDGWMQKMVRVLSNIFLTLSSWFGVGHSIKNATLTDLAAALATDKVKLRATTAPRIKLIIFFIIFLC